MSGTKQLRTGRDKSPWRRAWSRWVGFARAVADVQIVILLTLVYWGLITPMAIVFKLLSDPLGLRRRCGRWITRDPHDDVLDTMRNQYFL